jgi:hypothetical protein
MSRAGRTRREGPSSGEGAASSRHHGAPRGSNKHGHLPARPRTRKTLSELSVTGGTGCLCVFCHCGPSCGRSHIPGIYLSDLPKPARPSNRATGQHAGAARAALKGGAGGGAGTPLRQTGVTLTTLLPLGREALCHTAVRLESVAPPGAHCTFYSRTVCHAICPFCIIAPAADFCRGMLRRHAQAHDERWARRRPRRGRAAPA